MIRKEDMHKCLDCKKLVFFISGEEHEVICPECGSRNLNFLGAIDTDREAAEQKRQEEARRDAANKSGFVFVQCPYCQSHETKKITSASRVASVGLFGWGVKNWGNSGIVISVKVIFKPGRVKLFL